MTDYIKFIDRDRSVIILRFFSESSDAYLPDQVGDRPVTELADHIFAEESSVLYSPAEVRTAVLTGDCFLPCESAKINDPAPELCGRRLRFVHIPEGVKAVGNYAFYGCDQLLAVSFPSTLQRIGTGLFYSCEKLGRLNFSIPVPGNETPSTPSVLKEILKSQSQEVEIRAKSPDGKREYYRLIFPGFYEEPKENTPARIIQIIWHGTGYSYRQCFQGRKLQFSSYDRLLPAAEAQEADSTLVRMALGRLKTPVDLTDENRKAYLTLLGGKLRPLWEIMVQDQETDLVQWLQLLEDQDFYTQANINTMIDLASASRKADASAYLMDLKHRKFSSRPAQARFLL